MEEGLWEFSREEWTKNRLTEKGFNRSLGSNPVREQYISDVDKYLGCRLIIFSTLVNITKLWMLYMQNAFHDF